MHRVDVQHGRSRDGERDGTFDVFVNNEHYMHYHSHEDAITGAREAAGDAPNVTIRDYTRPTGDARCTIVEPMLPKWPNG